MQIHIFINAAKGKSRQEFVEYYLNISYIYTYDVTEQRPVLIFSMDEIFQRNAA